MKEIWDIINKMKKKSYLIFLFTIILLSCSDSNNSIMNQVDVKTPAVFNLPDLDGKYINATDLKGSYVLVNFWATWCAPCIEEIPELNKLFRDNDNIQLVGIAIDDIDAVNKFISKTPINYESLISNDIKGVEISKSLGNDRGVLPFTVLIKPNAKIQRVFYGKLDMVVLNSYLKDVIK